MKKRVINLFLILVLLFSFSNNRASAEIISEGVINEKWNESFFQEDYIGYKYPVLPGTDKWPYGNHQLMVDICQIPEEIFSSMTTEELAATILAYPLNADMYAYDNFETGFSIVKENFNGLQEFCKRTDNAKCLVNLLLNYSKDREVVLENERAGFIKTTEDEKNQNQRKFFEKMTLSLFLSQDEIWANMSLQDKMRYISINNSQQDMGWSTEKKINHMMETTAVSFFGFPLNGPFRQIGEPVMVKTPKGGNMQGYVLGVTELWEDSAGNIRELQFSDFSDAAKDVLNAEFYSLYGLLPVSEPSIKYNCHSYAWYRQTNCNYWINAFSTQGYSLVSVLNVPIGGKAVYYSNNSTSSPYTHSAVVESKVYLPGISEPAIGLKSKWGMCGVYSHLLQNCPYYYYQTAPMLSPGECAIEYYN